MFALAADLGCALSCSSHLVRGKYDWNWPFCDDDELLVYMVL